MHLKIFEICIFKYIDPACFLTASKLAWQSALKKIKVKLVLSTDMDMLLMVEKGHAIIHTVIHAIINQYQIGKKYMRYGDKNKEPWYPKYWRVKFIWMANVEKVVCKWLYMDEMYIWI